MKANVKHQSMPVPRTQPKVQHQQSTPVTHNSAQSHRCKWYGRTSHERKSCPARNAKYESCGTVGHSICVDRKKHRVAVVQKGTLVDDNDDRIMGEAAFCDAVNSLDDGSRL